MADPRRASKHTNPSSKLRQASPPTVLSPTALVEKFDEVRRIVDDEGKRIAIRKDGRTIAGLVSASDLTALESLEDLLDELDAGEALVDYRANGGVSFKKVMSGLGL